MAVLDLVFLVPGRRKKTRPVRAFPTDEGTLWNLWLGAGLCSLHSWFALCYFRILIHFVGFGGYRTQGRGLGHASFFLKKNIFISPGVHSSIVLTVNAI